MKNKILKGFLGIYAAFALMLMFGTDANAYIDPSVMTVLIQSIAGVVIVVGAAVGLYFRRAKKKINDKLGIDENKNKEVESDEIILKTEAAGQEAAAETVEAVSEEVKEIKDGIDSNEG